MKPEIDTENLYTILFSCVEYVDYFNEVDVPDDFFEKVLYILFSLKDYLELYGRSEIDGVKLEG